MHLGDSFARSVFTVWRSACYTGMINPIVKGKGFIYLFYGFSGRISLLVQHSRHMDGRVIGGFCIVLINNENAWDLFEIGQG